MRFTTSVLWLALSLLLSTAVGASDAPDNTVTRGDVLLAEVAPLAASPITAPLAVPYQEQDLLAYIAERLVLPTSTDKSVRQEYDWYRRHPDYLTRVFTRAQRYLPFIVEEIEKRGMPIDIALLPVVESAFDPFAYSHGRAAGLWQFIPGTARMYGLKQDWWYDGRRDVAASTTAALDYLEVLYRKTDDWLLAIASYNSGEGRVIGAMRRNKKAGKPSDFWHLKLPRETRAYVPKLLAIAKIVADRQLLDVALPRIEPIPYFAKVHLDGQIDLALAAEFAETTLDEIYRLNPGFNRWATSPSGPHQLLIPFAARELFAQRLAETPVDARVKWQRYRIREGDALSTIAKRHGTTVGVLKEANNLRGNNIRAGKHLMIPSASATAADYALSVDGRARRRAQKASGQRYTVRRGDSFWSIGRKFGVSQRKVAAWNGMAPGDTLAAGRELIIRTGGKTSAAAPVISGGPAGTQRRVSYVVRNGDSLSGISSRFRVSVKQLVTWNKLDRNKYLQPGQRIVMYVDVTRQSGG